MLIIICIGPELATRRSNLIAMATSSSDMPPSYAEREWDGVPILNPSQLLHPHNDLAHRYWKDALLHSPQRPPVAVDATVGNGGDAVVLAEALTMVPGGGSLICCDGTRMHISNRGVALHQPHPLIPAFEPMCAQSSSLRLSVPRSGCVRRCRDGRIVAGHGSTAKVTRGERRPPNLTCGLAAGAMASCRCTGTELTTLCFSQASSLPA